MYEFRVKKFCLYIITCFGLDKKFDWMSWEERYTPGLGGDARFAAINSCLGDTDDCAIWTLLLQP